MEGDNQYFCEQAGRNVRSECMLGMRAPARGSQQLFPAAHAIIAAAARLPAHVSSSTALARRHIQISDIRNRATARNRAQVDAVRRTCIKALPDTLVLHLKRFEFDYETMLRLKLCDRCACASRESVALGVAWLWRGVALGVASLWAWHGSGVALA